MNLSLGYDTPLEDLPMELSDLSVTTQQAYEAWSYLHPIVDSMSGVIVGRDMAGFKSMCESLDIEMSPTLTRIAAKLNQAWTTEAQKMANQKAKQAKKGNK